MKRQKNVGRRYKFNNDIANKISKYGVFIDRFDAKIANIQTKNDAQEVVTLISDVLPDLHEIKAHFEHQSKLWSNILALFEESQVFYQEIADGKKVAINEQK